MLDLESDNSIDPRAFNDSYPLKESLKILLTLYYFLRSVNMVYDGL